MTSPQSNNEDSGSSTSAGVVAGTIVAASIATAVLLNSSRKSSTTTDAQYPPAHLDNLLDLATLGRSDALKHKVETLEDGSTLCRPYLEDPDKELLKYNKEDGPFFNVSPTGTMNIRQSESAMGALAPETVLQRFATAVSRHGDHPALVSATGKTYTWNQYHDQVKRLAKSLIKTGVSAGGSVNIIGFNSPEWLIMNMAAIFAGGKAAGIYTSNGPEACQYISEHSEAVVVAVENKAQLDKFLAIRGNLPHLKAIVMWDGELPENVNANPDDVPCYTWAEFAAFGDDESLDASLEARMAAQKPGDPCTLIYTSGTTGNPKAVMISHDNLNWCSSSLMCVVGKDFGSPKRVHGEHVVSYLPLSHIAAQILDLHSPLAIVSTLGANVTVWFADNMALKGTLLATLQKARPTIFFGVPRVWEKFAEAMKKKGAANSGLKKAIVAWAKGKGLDHFQSEQNNGSGSGPWGFLIANVLLKKVRVQIGLDRCEYCFTGAAPIGHDTLNFFGALNIPVLELYGMSECTGPHTVSHPHAKGFQVGSTGPCMPGCEMKILHEAGRDKEGEGEICYRGRHVMMGYMNNEEKTRETIDEDGWLHSGDVGRIDENGMLYITGRIKEIIITAGGENIPPVPIEEEIKKFCPAISNFMMIGDKRKYNTALVTLKTEPNENGTFSDKLFNEAALVNPDVKTVSEAQNDPKWAEYIQAGIDHYNNNAISHATRIQYYRILDEDFSVPGGELGPTLKLKRGTVMTKYEDVIEKMYTK